MLPLYFISNRPYSGKSSMCVGLGKKFIEEGLKVGYMKPVGTLPIREGGKTIDEDAQYISGILDMKDELEAVSPIVITQQYVRQRLVKEGSSKDLMDIIQKSYNRICKNKNMVILEGAKSIEDGYFMGVSSHEICRTLNAKAVLVIRYSNELIDQILFAKKSLGDCFSGAIINWVPSSQIEYLTEIVLPFLEERSVKIFGYIPSCKMLSAVSIKEIAENLGGSIICAEEKAEELVESFMVGAMGQEQALKYFRRKSNKAVITGGDRSDVQLAALETPTKCLILTGNFQPSSIVLGRAEELGVPMILVNYDTLTAVEKVEKIIGHVRFHEAKKIDKIVEIVKDCIDTDALLCESKK